MRSSLLAILAEHSTSYGFAETETNQEAVIRCYLKSSLRGRQAGLYLSRLPGQLSFKLGKRKKNFSYHFDVYFLARSSELPIDYQPQSEFD